MASKWSIENSANIKMLINLIQTAGGIDEDNKIFFMSPLYKKGDTRETQKMDLPPTHKSS